MKSYLLTAPSRLHFGFLDFQNLEGHAFGSFGLALDKPCLKIQLDSSQDFKVEGDSAQRALAFAQQSFAQHHCSPYGYFNILNAIPEHSGLGSGTQMALAIGHLVALLCGEKVKSTEIAQQTGRGKRSGIGLGAFDCGGFLVDGGKRDEKPPDITIRYAFPEEWKIILISNALGNNIHGDKEVRWFSELPSFSRACAGVLCRHLLLGILPALIQRDYQNFAKMLRSMQNTIGDYFSAVQGHRYADQGVREVLEYLHGQGIECIGQSSWGPTGFAIVENPESAEQVVAQLEQKFANADLSVRWQVTSANNHGHDLNIK